MSAGPSRWARPRRSQRRSLCAPRHRRPRCPGHEGRPSSPGPTRQAYVTARCRPRTPVDGRSSIPTNADPCPSRGGERWQPKRGRGRSCISHSTTCGGRPAQGDAGRNTLAVQRAVRRRSNTSTVFRSTTSQLEPPAIIEACPHSRGVTASTTYENPAGLRLPEAAQRSARPTRPADTFSHSSHRRVSSAYWQQRTANGRRADPDRRPPTQKRQLVGSPSTRAERPGFCFSYQLPLKPGAATRRRRPPRPPGHCGTLGHGSGSAAGSGNGACSSGTGASSGGTGPTTVTVPPPIGQPAPCGAGHQAPPSHRLRQAGGGARLDSGERGRDRRPSLRLAAARGRGCSSGSLVIAAARSPGVAPPGHGPFLAFSPQRHRAGRAWAGRFSAPHPRALLGASCGPGLGVGLQPAYSLRKKKKKKKKTKQPST